ncbi:MAG TPA: hypothetical protein VK447_03845 [Myxococcaceae bacterium]|nr:hypothetical protein [Myxococcaceae bacterium]
MLGDYSTLAVAIGWVLTVLLGLLGLLILGLIARGKINLQKLISEPSGDASLSRFQYLIFTFVIAMSLFLITLSQTPPKFPDVPSGILVLLGISSGAYVASKGISSNRDVATKLAGADESATEEKQG